MIARADLEKHLDFLKYELALREAEDDLIRFAEVTMPDQKLLDEVAATRYDAADHHRYMAELMMRVEAGEKKKVILNLPPRHGKSELCTKRFAAWYHGRNPQDDIIVATYNEKFANDFGKEIREIVTSERFRQIFPDYYLTTQSNEMVTNYAGGKMYFLGRRSATTGRGGNLILVDDPTKDDKEVKSDLFREDCWQWFTQTLLTRRHNDKSAIVVTQCMTGDTLVLRPDGTETQLREIRVGDRIATYEDGMLTASTVRNWANNGRDRVYTMRMTSGTVVRANERHPFLVVKNGVPEWIRLENIKQGHEILRVNGENGPGLSANKTGAMNHQDAKAIAVLTTINGGGRRATGHLPAILSQGARHICATAMELILQTTNAFVPNKVAFAPYASTHLVPEDHRTIGGKNSVLTTATTQERCAGFFATNAISLSADQTTPKFSLPQRNMSDFTPDTVAEIRVSGFEDVFDIQVDRTENFIANGLVSHNTRWHEDDIVGRITDKTNPAYSPKFAAGFEVINLAAIAGPDDPLKRKPGTPLWPTRFGIEYLEEMQEANSVSFAALYQCDPTPDDGVFYRQEELHEYDLIDLPSRMTFYAASDHAVGTRAVNDPTCMVPFGICENDIAWVLPDVSWRRMDTKEAVEEMIGIIKTRKPVFWYAEKGHISKAIGPFLQARLKEEEVYCPIIEDHPTADKIQRAQSGRARAAQGRIRFPRFAPWWPRAKSELLKFPNGRFDDFVDVVSTIGMKLATHTGPGRASVAEKKYGPGTYGHLLRQFKVDDMMEKSKVARAGW